MAASFMPEAVSCRQRATITLAKLAHLGRRWELGIVEDSRGLVTMVPSAPRLELHARPAAKINGPRDVLEMDG